MGSSDLIGSVKTRSVMCAMTSQINGLITFLKFLFFLFHIPPFPHLYAKSNPLGSLSFFLILSHLFLINFLLSRGSYFNTPTSYFILSKTVWGYQLFNGEEAEEYVNID